MYIPLHELRYTFKRKPLLVGGNAMEFYGLRKSGKDIDLIADENDIAELLKLYPKRVKNLWGDLGVCPKQFEIWKTISYLGYDDLNDDAVDIGNVLVISEEKLLLTKVLTIHKEKYLKDMQLIAENILKRQNQKYEDIVRKNNELLKGIDITYIEKTGPEV